MRFRRAFARRGDAHASPAWARPKFLAAVSSIIFRRVPGAIAAFLFPGLFCLGMAGCQTHRAVMPLGGGFEEVAHPVHSLIVLDEPPAPRISFQYHPSGGKATEIWPSLYGVNEIVKGKLAIFVGDKAYIDPDRVTHPRLFAVMASNLPVDITDELLRRWAKVAGKDFQRARERFVLATPEETDAGLLVRLDFSASDQWMGRRDDWPDGVSVRLTWSQVEEMMQTVKSRGVTAKDLRWNTPYIEDRH